jgi:hypothetical protein
MYRCDQCGATVPPRNRARRVVVETRERIYPARLKANRVVSFVNGKRKVVLKDDPGGFGEETVREVVVCQTCSTTRT